ncbi:CAP domain-containing protein [Mycena leptocephala]|nr:CAP domain-containing protein [Mycena leptocephala]
MIFFSILVFAALANALATPNSHFPASRHSHVAKRLIDFPSFPNPDVQNTSKHTTPEGMDWAETCQLKHSNGTLLDTPYGENIVAATGHFPISMAMQQFVLDKSDYDPANPTYNHFTQVVWKSTTDLGCAFSLCNNIFEGATAWYYVCLYNPAGNVVGQALTDFCSALQLFLLLSNPNHLRVAMYPLSNFTVQNSQSDNEARQTPPNTE